MNRKKIEMVIAEISKGYSQYQFFFDNLSSPEWIKPLSEEGHFIKPPKREIDRNGQYYYPIWPWSQYLHRMAASNSEIVANAIEKIEITENIFVINDIVKVANEIPIEQTDRLIKRIEIELNPQSAVWGYKDYNRFIIKLLENNRISESFRIFKKLFQLLPDPRVEDEKGQIAESLYMPEPIPIFDQHFYKESLEKIIPLLTEKAGIDGLIQICNLLNDGINLTKKVSNGEKSYNNGPTVSLENFEQERIYNDSLDILIWAVRKCAELLMNDEGIKTLNTIEGYNHLIFKRLGMYLRWKNPTVDIKGNIELLSKKDTYTNIWLLPERYHLLEKCFGQLPANKRRTYYNFINEVIKNDNEQRRRYTEFSFLYPICSFLKGEKKKVYKRLREEFDPPESPDALVSHTTTSWGFKSPISSEELKSMSFSEMIEYLKSVKPTGDYISDEDTLEGIGIILKEITIESPENFAINANYLKGIQPAFINRILDGFREIVKSESEIINELWEPILQLCEWITKQNRNEQLRWGHYSTIDPGWFWTRKAITDLLEEGLKRNSIPLANKDLIWKTLEALCEDPHPDAEEENKDYDSFTEAINSVRGNALFTTFIFCEWLYKNNGSGVEVHGFDDIPDIKSVIEEHLDIEKDASLAIHSVYGFFFPFIASFDKEWAQQNYQLIFPTDPDSLKYFRAAWYALIKYNYPKSFVFKMIKNVYAYAIESIGEWEEQVSSVERAEEHLAEHLMTLYWYSEIEYENPDEFLPRFFEKSSDRLRAHAIEYLGRSIPHADREVMKRLRELITKRIDKIRQVENTEDYHEELSSFGMWIHFSNKTYKWMIDVLLDIVEITKKIELDKHVLEKLEKKSQQYPEQVCKIVNYLIEGSKDTWHLQYLKNDIKSILVKVKKTGNQDMINQAKRIANRMTAINISFLDDFKCICV